MKSKKYTINRKQEDNISKITRQGEIFKTLLHLIIY